MFRFLPLACWLLSLATFAPRTFAAEKEADELRVLTVTPPKNPRFGPLYDVLMAEAFECLDRRRLAYEKVKTPEQVQAWQKERREFFLRQIGAFPDRTPLEAKVVRRLDGDGCRIENVLFASRPGHHVTANLYLPPGKGPYPAVIVPCGHSYNGKAADAYQRVSLLLARNGIAALCYDPIGQGERYQVFDAHGQPLANLSPARPDSPMLAVIPGVPTFDPVEEHLQVGLGAALVGRNTAHYRIWDGMRALDYLQSRPDIDGKRLGCTGISGGGTLTAYLMALDDRIFSAAPGCYLTTFRRLLETNGPQDAEQNIFGQIAFGMDEGDYPILRAPRPTLLLAGTRDVTFAIDGTWDIAREAKRMFSRLGQPERFDISEADEPHGFPKPLRVASVRWMRRWLLGVDDAIDEPDMKVRTLAELSCTPASQVLRLPGERSAFDFNQDEAKRLAKLRREDGKAGAELRSRIRATVGVRTMSDLPALKVAQVGEVRRPGLRIEKWTLTPPRGLVLPALAFWPVDRDKIDEAVLYVHGHGKLADAGPDGAIERLARTGKLVLALDLSGLGETAPPRKKGGYQPSDQEAMLAYLLGKSLVGMRTEEVLAAARVLADFGRTKRKVHLVGIEAAGLPALHAAALEPGLFASLETRRTLVSWENVVRTPNAVHQQSNIVHAALRVYDLPDLRELAQPLPQRVVDPVDACGRRLDK